jgi:hypothetical protein
MPPIRQTSFAAGELSPSLWARDDFDKYSAGARRLHNFVPTPWGSAANRPGTRYAGETYGNGQARLIPFTFSETDTLMLVFTDQLLRFYTLDPVTGLPGVVLKQLATTVYDTPYVAAPPPSWAVGATVTILEGNGIFIGSPYPWGGSWVGWDLVFRAGGRLRITVRTDAYHVDTQVIEEPSAIVKAQLETDGGTTGTDWYLDNGVFEVVTPYTAAELPRLRYAQVGDVVTLCHPSHEPRELTRTFASPLNFSLAAISFDVPAFPADVAVYAQYPMATETLPTYPAKQWVVKVTAICEDLKGNIYETKAFTVAEQRARLYDALKVYTVGEYVYYGTHNWLRANPTPAAGETPGASLYDSDADTIPDAQCWTDMGVPPAIPDLFPVYTAKQQTFFAENNIAANPGFRVKAFRVFRGRGALMGYVGELDETLLFLADTGETPDWTRTPPKGENPFKVYTWENTLLRTENPSVVTFHEQRRVFARTNERPGFIFFSATNAFSIFDQHDPAVSEDSLTTELASWRWEEIRSLVSGRVLLALSSSTEWAADGGQEGAAITPLGWATRPRTERGISWVEPLKVGDDEVLFVPPAGNLVRELSYDGNQAKYSAVDLTMLSKHLFKGRQIIAWDWQEDPWSIIWVVLDNGQLLSLSYAQGQVAAWAWHDTAGLVEEVCCVREGTEDAVYLVVARTIGGATKRYIERLNTRQVTSRTESLFLDSALTYRGAPATHFTGLAHLEGQTVVALADGQVARTGPDGLALVVTAGAIDLDPGAFPDGASVVHVGLAYASELELLDLPPGNAKGLLKSVSEVVIEFEDTGAGYVGQKFPTGTDPTKGLEELRLREVSDSYAASPGLKNGLMRVPVSAEWNQGGRAVVVQLDPLPMTVLAVTREAVYGAP